MANKQPVMLALHIDSKAGTIAAVEINTRDIGKLVGGLPTLAPVRLPDGDLLYVNDDGMRAGDAEGFFRFEGCEQPLFGSGVIVGREQEDAMGDWWNDPPASNVASVAASLRFLTREEVAAWGKANAAEPAVSLYSTGPEGGERHEVLQTYGQLIDESLKPKG